MATNTLVFPNDVNVSFGSGADRTARVLKANFGGSKPYVQRAADGLNNVNQSYSLTVSILTREESKYLDDFFRERAGWQTFWFKVPGETDPRLWTCEKWAVRHVADNHDDFTATFTEQFLP
ncbi:minor tail protein M [Rhizobium phage RHph_TM16]|nr:minor tail protein M [Rhizobium phage RHph_TM16]